MKYRICTGSGSIQNAFNVHIHLYIAVVHLDDKVFH